MNKSKPCGFFDGTSKGSPGPCGAGGVLIFFDTQWFSFMLSLGIGTNNWVELRAMALLLRITIEKDIVQLQVFSYLGVVINWMRGVSRVLNIGLQAVVEQGRDLLDRFQNFTFKHDFRELNTKADELSKRATESHVGLLELVERKDEMNISLPSRQSYD
jgi:ribonuclease HI